jgi:hypothetical protein
MIIKQLQLLHEGIQKRAVPILLGIRTVVSFDVQPKRKSV